VVLTLVVFFPNSLTDSGSRCELKLRGRRL